ncbi:MAG: YlqD family protein [Bacillota bacterium]
MLISRAVTVKSRVTPELRSQLAIEAQKALKELEGEISRLEESLRNVPTRSGDISQLGKHRQELLERKESLLGNLKDIARLKDGQEIARGQIQGFYDIKVGDIWPDVLSCEVILEDGKVVAIREGDNVTLSLNLHKQDRRVDDEGAVEPREG